MSMDQELKTKWVEALRSGEFRQTSGKLHDQETDSYCCLGVLCKVAGAEFGTAEIEAESDEGSYPSTIDHAPVLNGRVLVDDDAEELSDAFSKEIGIEDQQFELIKRNDGFGEDPAKPEFVRQQTFQEIADYIEENL